MVSGVCGQACLLSPFAKAAFLAQAMSCQAAACVVSANGQTAQSSGLMLLETSKAGGCHGAAVPGLPRGPPQALKPLGLCEHEDTNERPRDDSQELVIRETTGEQPGGHENAVSRSDVALRSGPVADQQGCWKGWPYQCGTCDQSFQCYSDVVKHECTHSGEKPYEYRDCGKAFIHSSHVV